ncbi:MAG: DeoR/GlpR family DNA-binding transcription regulator [Spirochaetaceae bacterium]|jgi:DeoR/GlpR family transcriptional regulator of sugar metabolism|nr:DeoR/GlpR family DNA-binding transcription regulator [Spirochaetaceae bacterium]
MTERQEKILIMLAANSQVKVNTLAEKLAVSQVTIRKDLDYLDNLGFIKREHGYAILGSSEDVSRRMATNYEIKRKIAKIAAQTVEEGETVLIESGSCCTLLAEELANHKRVKIITNSAFLANHIRNAPYADLILLGGEYQTGSQVMVGAMTGKWANIFLSDKFFVGVDGFTEKFGFTGQDHLRTQTARSIARQAREVYVLTDSDKFLHQGRERLLKPSQVTAVFTDDRIPPAKDHFLQNRNVRIHKVSSAKNNMAA